MADFSTIIGIRGMVSPNSAYAKLMDSVFATPSRTFKAPPSTQIGSVGILTPQAITQIQQQIGIKLVFDKSKQIWTTPAGLDYGLGSIHGNRIQHVLAHTVPNTQKATHSVFNVSRSEVLPLIDEAWKMRGYPVISGRRSVYNISMGKIIGTNGETNIRIVTEAGTSKIVTAFPFK